ncbi:MAG: RNA pseudouridine synthase [Candidatus Pacebacteria bacterium]|nr:RNA pseudouridine synthase [Candidatus Paceibacterota bacterium]
MQIIHENSDLLVIDKEPGITIEELTSNLLKRYSFLKDLPRAGIVHRLDKDTSGLLLIAKNVDSLNSLQKEFKEKKVEKKYICLVIGKTENHGEIKTLLGRNPNNRLKQKVYSFTEPKVGTTREAITEYKKIKEFKDYSLLEVKIQTGRKHQIRCHLSYINHPIAGDNMYGFKNQTCPKELSRQFLHAKYIKIKNKEFFSELPKDLKKVLDNLI